MRPANYLIFAAVLAAGVTSADAQPCVADATHLCYQSGRFGATASYQTPGGLASAAAVQPAGGLPGYFRFDDPAAAEIVLELLDGCAVNSRIWVIAKSVSNAGLLLVVTDHQLGTQQSYSVPIGDYGAPFVDTTAFECGALAGSVVVEDSQLLGAAMDLFGGRFRVTATLPTVTGQAQQLNRNSGVLSFFAPEIPDVLVKIFYPGNPGVFGVAASWTQADTTLEVEDLCTGEMRVYHTGTNDSFGDPDAFSADHAVCGLFSNGFESGNTSAWNLTVP